MVLVDEAYWTRTLPVWPLLRALAADREMAPVDPSRRRPRRRGPAPRRLARAALVASVDRDEAERALVEMVGPFASRMDAWLLAEGVETGAEIETPARLGRTAGPGLLPGAAGRAVATAGPRHRRAAGSFATRSRASTLRSLVENAGTAFSPRTRPRPFADDNVDLGDARRVRPPRRAGRPARHHQAQGYRFHPMACLDDAGRFVGLVRLERIVDFLAGPANDRRLPVGRGLDAVELGVLPAEPHQLLVRADLGDPRTVEDHDQVRHAHGREAVRHQDRDAAVSSPRSARAAAA